MKRISWKKVVSLVVALALVIGGINLGARKVSADGEGEGSVEYLTVVTILLVEVFDVLCYNVP